MSSENRAHLFTVPDDMLWASDYEDPNPTQTTYIDTVHTLDEEVYKKLLESHGFDVEEIEEEKKKRMKDGAHEAFITLTRNLYATGATVDEIFQIEKAAIFPHLKKRDVQISWRQTPMTPAERAEYDEERTRARKYARSADIVKGEAMTKAAAETIGSLQEALEESQKLCDSYQRVMEQMQKEWNEERDAFKKKLDEISGKVAGTSSNK